MIIGGFVTASYALFETTARNQTKAMLQDEENFIMQKILYALETAKTVSVPSQNSLTITSYSGSTVTINSSGTNVLWNGGAQPLNNSNVSVNTLKFTHVGSGTDPEYVQVELSVSAKMPNGLTLFDSASSTRYLRK